MCCGRGQCDGCDEGEMGVVTGRGFNAATPLGAIKSGESRQHDDKQRRSICVAIPGIVILHHKHRIVSGSDDERQQQQQPPRTAGARTIGNRFPVEAAPHRQRQQQE
jgi:hypothetical protein